MMKLKPAFAIVDKYVSFVRMHVVSFGGLN